MAKETSWGAVSGWYDETVGNPTSYQSSLILPNLIRVLNPLKGEKILDVACGQGIFSREIAKKGAEVCGVDISSELIDIAKKDKSVNVIYEVASAEKLDNLKSDSFDAAICVLALQNIRDTSSALAEVSRVLKQGSRFVVVLNHPCFRVPKRSGWDFDDKKVVQYRRVEGYLSEAMIEIDMEPGKGGYGAKTVSFHRPLQLYFKQLQKQGFLVRRLEEWESNKKSEAGPRQKAEDLARKEIPLFMVIEAIKAGSV